MGELENISAGKAVFVKDRRHRCVLINDECCRLMGVRRKAALGKTNYDFLPKEHADRIWEKEERVFTTGKEDLGEDSFRDMRRGVTHTYSTTKTLFLDGSGAAWLIGVVSDVTAHGRALEECRFMRSLLEAQNEASIAGILVVDDAGLILTANRRFREMWGIPPESLAAKSDGKALRAVMNQVVDPEDFRKRVIYFRDHRGEKSSGAVELRDGRIFDVYSAPVTGEDGVYRGRVWHFRDISDMRKVASLKAEIEQRSRLDALKDQFIGTVSHELRTPLTVVRTAVDSLRGGVAGKLTPGQQEVADLCGRNVLRLSKMISNLLDISRLESGSAKVRLVALDLRALLKDMEENFRMMGKGKEISIRVDAPAGLPQVRGDSELIGEVLYNLLDNAARFARSAVRVTARRERGPSSGRETEGVRIEVIDDGPGISPDKIGFLFNKFSQVERAVGGGGYKGTGLGLAICKEIMSLHGSSIEVDSAPGRGARFRFFLPEWTAEPAVPARAAAGRGRS